MWSHSDEGMPNGRAGFLVAVRLVVSATGQHFTFQPPHERRHLSVEADQTFTSQACKDLTFSHRRTGHEQTVSVDAVTGSSRVSRSLGPSPPAIIIAALAAIGAVEAPTDTSG